MFAGSCIGVICLVLCLEFLRRVGREYDAFIVQRARLRALYLSAPSVDPLIQQGGAAIPECEQERSSKVNTASCCESHGHTHMHHDHADTDPSFSSDNIKDDIITSAPVQHCAPPMQTTAPCAHRNTPPGAPISTIPAALSIPFPRTTANGLPNPWAVGPLRPSLIEQLVRALLHMLQFAVAYFVMLLAMYFNGYIIICIFIGAFLGSFIFSWEPVSLSKE
jgi:copper transporter 1